jgi:hypothetical protein
MYIVGHSLDSDLMGATGTTCATVLTQAILAEGCKAVAAGVNVMDLRNGMNKSINAITTHLKSKAWKISSPDEINQVRYLYVFFCSLQLIYGPLLVIT